MVHVILALTLTAAAPTVDFDREAALKTFLAGSCADVDVWRAMWRGMKERSPCEVLHSLPVLPAAFKAAASELARGWSIPEAAAVPILESELFQRTDPRRYSEREKFAAWTTARFEAALAAAPASPSLIHAIAVAHGEGVPLDLLEKGLAGFEHPAPVALSLMRGTYPVVASLAAVVAMKDDPSTLADVAENVTAEGDLPLPFTLQLLQVALDGGVGAPVVAPLGREVLAEVLRQELPELALELWAGLPPSARVALLALPQGREPRDVPLELSVAALEVGDAALSKSLAPSVRQPDWSKATNSDLARESCSKEVLQEALLRTRDPKRAARDPFDFARAFQSCYGGPNFAGVFAPLLVARQPALAERLRRAALPDAVSRAAYAKRSEHLHPSAVAFAAAADERITRARERRQALLRSRLDTVEQSKPRRELADASATVWKERPLPSGIRTSDERKGPTSPEGVKLPAGYWATRIEHRSDEVWALASSQTLDPMGEVGSGGYWLFRSTDGGHDWEPPLYTGLREFQPYEVTATSDLPLVSSGKVTI